MRDTIYTVADLLNWDIQNRFKDTAVVYTGSAFDKGAIVTDYIKELDLYEGCNI